MPILKHSVPKYRKHRGSGQAIVTIAGRDHYLGSHGTKASRIEYDRLISEWLVAGRPATIAEQAGITVTELILQSSGKGYDIQLLDIDPNSYDGQSGCMGDVAWVYQNLSVKSAAPHQTPSSGAWGLLQWARRNSDKFFPLWAKTMPGQAVQDTEPWEVKKDNSTLNIERMLAALNNGGYKNGDIDCGAR